MKHAKLLSQPLKTYDVYVFTLVRVKAPSISAHSPQEAITQACDRYDFHDLFQKEDETIAWAEEHAGFFVDEEKSRQDGESPVWFHAKENTLYPILASLVAWRDELDNNDELDDIINEARIALDFSC